MSFTLSWYVGCYHFLFVLKAELVQHPQEFQNNARVRYISRIGRRNMRRLMVLLFAGLLAGGCYVSDNADESGSDPQEQTGESARANNEDAAPDQEEWDNIRWHTGSGPSGKGATQVMTLDGEITSDGRFVRFAWDRYPWSDSGLGHFFVWDGSKWIGGKFDWIRPGGQGIKELKNIRAGYNGLRAPPTGTRVAFAWTSADGKERSNLVRDTWR